jgi:potassium-dependent mechanosensitive channel
LSLLFSANCWFFPALVLWQDNMGALTKVWDYLNRRLAFGSVEVSVASLAGSIALLIATIILSRKLGALLERRIAKRAYIDPGLRYTMVRIARYFLIIVGVLLALQFGFNINLTSLAVVFTALSVGIGFGLQYIAADIASGFILLFERPIRVGDRITIGDDEGDVQSINLRTTLVITNDRISIIVPNSRLVSQRVINWSYGDPRARIAIPMSAAYSSDVKLVTATLLEAAADVEHVLADPPPKVQFLSFAEYSLDFRLLVWTRHPSRHPQIKSDINYRIERLFRDRGIEIPFPTQQFLFRTGDVDRLRDNLLPGDKASERDSVRGEREAGRNIHPEE